MNTANLGLGRGERGDMIIYLQWRLERRKTEERRRDRKEDKKKMREEEEVGKIEGRTGQET